MNLESVCPRCGGPSPLGLCDRCRMEMANLLDCPDSVEVTVCPVCGSTLLRGRWQDAEATVEDLITDAVAAEVGTHRDLANPEVSISVRRKNATQYLVSVHLAGTFGEIPAEEERIVAATVRRATCERCSRMAGNYYEAIVQVRGSKGAPSKEELKETQKIAEATTDYCLSRGDRLSFVQEVREVKGGIDLVLGSTQQGRAIARAIQDRLGGISGESYRLVGMKDGKNVYRTTILVRLPRLRAGEIVRAKGAFMEVRRFEGKRTFCSSLLDGHTAYLSEEDAEDALVVGDRSSAERGLVVAGDRDVLEFLDPESYRAVSASRPVHLRAGPGDEIEFLRFRGDMVILPPRDKDV